MSHTPRCPAFYGSANCTCDLNPPKGDEALREIIGCFDAAEAEGLSQALAETTDERLKDLIERRVMHALYAAQKALE